jgi:predicted signal transduction protein with EAL and GGDEF domain
MKRVIAAERTSQSLLTKNKKHASRDRIDQSGVAKSIVQARSLRAGTCRDSAERAIGRALRRHEFKNVNDTLGHRIGDELLKSVAEILSRWYQTDRLRRPAGRGEEFAIVQTAAKDSAMSWTSTPVYRAIREPYECLGHQVRPPMPALVLLWRCRMVSVWSNCWRMRTQQCMAPKPIERHLSLLRTGHGLERDKRAPASGLSACRLELEITEAVLIRDGEAALANCTSAELLACGLLADKPTQFQSAQALRHDIG